MNTTRLTTALLILPRRVTGAHTSRKMRREKVDAWTPRHERQHRSHKSCRHSLIATLHNSTGEKAAKSTQSLNVISRIWPLFVIVEPAGAQSNYERLACNSNVGYGRR